MLIAFHAQIIARIRKRITDLLLQCILLFLQLAQLGVVSGEHLSENHAELGDVRALMALLVKRRIFMREHSSYDDPTMGYSYELAEGAEAIIGYENIDKFVINESMRSQIATV